MRTGRMGMKEGRLSPPIRGNHPPSGAGRWRNVTTGKWSFQGAGAGGAGAGGCGCRRRRVRADFSGGEISSPGGAQSRREADRRLVNRPGLPGAVRPSRSWRPGARRPRRNPRRRAARPDRSPPAHRAFDQCRLEPRRPGPALHPQRRAPMRRGDDPAIGRRRRLRRTHDTGLARAPRRPPRRVVDWTIPSTGKVTQVTIGTDPGRDHHPGRERSQYSGMKFPFLENFAPGARMDRLLPRNRGHGIDGDDCLRSNTGSGALRRRCVFSIPHAALADFARCRERIPLLPTICGTRLTAMRRTRYEVARVRPPFDARRGPGPADVRDPPRADPVERDVARFIADGKPFALFVRVVDVRQVDRDPRGESFSRKRDASNRTGLQRDFLDRDVETGADAAHVDKASVTCSTSSRTSSPTGTLVSTARTSASQERSDALVHVAHLMRIGRRGEQGIVDVPRDVLRRPPDDHLVPPLAPLDGRTRGRSQLLPNARRYRDPALRRDSGFDPFHPGSFPTRTCRRSSCARPVAHRPDDGRWTRSHTPARPARKPARASPATGNWRDRDGSPQTQRTGGQDGPVPG